MLALSDQTRAGWNGSSQFSGVIMPEAGSAYSLIFYDVDNHGNLCLIVCKMFAIIALFTAP